jgi:hypothetical protein
MRHLVRAGRRVRLRVRVTSVRGGRIAVEPRASVRLGDRRARSGANGIALLRLRFRRAARATVVARKAGFTSATARLRVLPARR